MTSPLAAMHIAGHTVTYTCKWRRLFTQLSPVLSTLRLYRMYMYEADPYVHR